MQSHAHTVQVSAAFRTVHSAHCWCSAAIGWLLVLSSLAVQVDDFAAVESVLLHTANVRAKTDNVCRLDDVLEGCAADLQQAAAALDLALWAVAAEHLVWELGVEQRHQLLALGGAAAAAAVVAGGEVGWEGDQPVQPLPGGAVVAECSTCGW